MKNHNDEQIVPAALAAGFSGAEWDAIDAINREYAKEYSVAKEAPIRTFTDEDLDCAAPVSLHIAARIDAALDTPAHR